MKPKSIRKKECLKEMRTLIAQQGLYSLNISELSEKYSFRWHTIRDWRNNILREIPSEDWIYISKLIEQEILSAIKTLKEIINKGTISEKLKALTTLNNFLDSYQKRLIKEPIENQNNKISLEIVQTIEQVANNEEALKELLSRVPSKILNKAILGRESITYETFQELYEKHYGNNSIENKIDEEPPTIEIVNKLEEEDEIVISREQI